MFAENDPLTVSITVRSAQADGLIMILTIANNSEAIFAAGLRNGRVCCIRILFPQSYVHTA